MWDFLSRYRVLILGVIFILTTPVLIYLFGDSVFFLAPFLFGMCVIIGFFRFGNSMPAYVQARKGNIDIAEALLKAVKAPDSLSPLQRSYFYLAWALVDKSHQRLSASEQNFQRALYEGLLKPDEQAYAHFCLAQIYHLRGDESEMAERIRLARRAVESDRLKSEIDEFDESIRYIDSEPVPVRLFS